MKPIVKPKIASNFYDYFVRPIGCSLSYGKSTVKKIALFSQSFDSKDEATFALSQVIKYFHIEDSEVWVQRFQQMRFVDRLDLYLTFLSSSSWLNRWVSVEGRWPANIPFVAISFHYGAGFWVFRHMRNNLLSVTALRRAISISDFEDDIILYRYNCLRNWNLDRELSSKALIAGQDSVRAAIRALNSGFVFTGLFDIPGNGLKNHIELPFLGKVANFNRGLLLIAKRANVPIVVYTMSVCPDGVSRVLNISEPISSYCEFTAGCAVVAHLERAIVTDSTQWHEWGNLDLFFSGV